MGLMLLIASCCITMLVSYFQIRNSYPALVVFMIALIVLLIALRVLINTSTGNVNCN